MKLLFTCKPDGKSATSRRAHDYHFFTNSLSSSAPIAVRMAKKAIKNGFTQDLNNALDMERACYLQTLKTKDRNEALTAFKEKRKPNFIGE